MKGVSFRSVERLLKNSGCKRVSSEAVQELKKVLEKEGKKIGELAWKFTKHADRRTLMKEDIDLAVESIKASKSFIKP